jgi:hypothetical protein
VAQRSTQMMYLSFVELKCTGGAQVEHRGELGKQFSGLACLHCVGES